MNGCTIPYTPIAVDLWKQRQCSRVRLFFLSHVHLDQTCGLSSSWCMPIYCSPVSKKLLIRQFQLDESVVHELTLNTPHVVSLTSDGDVTMTVTLIDSHHCPGSVMFLFDGYFGRILYTGDFRYEESMLSTGPLADLTSNPIDALYIDNTFCSPKCTFPSRDEALREIISIIEQHPNERIVIGLRNLGKEEMLIALADRFNEKITVSAERYSLLELLGMQDRFIVNGNEESQRTRFEVIALVEVTRSNVDSWNRTSPTIAILPTALFVGLGYQPFVGCSDIYVVPYSDHSPYAELLEFVAHIRPKSVVPIIRTDPSSRDDPLASSLLDRTSVECFADCLDRTPMQNYHIPSAVLEMMNKSPVIGPRGRRRTMSVRRSSQSNTTAPVSRSMSFNATLTAQTCQMNTRKVLQLKALHSSRMASSKQSGSETTATADASVGTSPKPLSIWKPHVAVRPMKRCSSSDRLHALAIRPQQHHFRHRLTRGAGGLLVSASGLPVPVAVRPRAVVGGHHHMVSVLRLRNKDRTLVPVHRSRCHSPAVLQTSSGPVQQVLQVNDGSMTQYMLCNVVVVPDDQNATSQHDTSGALNLTQAVISVPMTSADVNVESLSSHPSEMPVAIETRSCEIRDQMSASESQAYQESSSLSSENQTTIVPPLCSNITVVQRDHNIEASHVSLPDSGCAVVVASSLTHNQPEHDAVGALNLSQPSITTLSANKDLLAVPTSSPQALHDPEPELVMYHIGVSSTQACVAPSVLDAYPQLPSSVANLLTSPSERHAINGLLGLSQQACISSSYQDIAVDNVCVQCPASTGVFQHQAEYCHMQKDATVLPALIVSRADPDSSQMQRPAGEPVGLVVLNALVPTLQDISLPNLVQKNYADHSADRHAMLEHGETDVSETMPRIAFQPNSIDQQNSMSSACRQNHIDECESPHFPAPALPSEKTQNHFSYADDNCRFLPSNVSNCSSITTNCFTGSILAPGVGMLQAQNGYDISSTHNPEAISHHSMMINHGTYMMGEHNGCGSLHSDIELTDNGAKMDAMPSICNKESDSHILICEEYGSQKSTSASAVTSTSSVISEHSLPPKKKWRRRFKSSQLHRAHQENKRLHVGEIERPEAVKRPLSSVSTGIWNGKGADGKCHASSVASQPSCSDGRQAKRPPLAVSHHLHHDKVVIHAQPSVSLSITLASTDPLASSWTTSVWAGKEPLVATGRAMLAERVGGLRTLERHTRRNAHGPMHLLTDAQAVSSACHPCAVTTVAALSGRSPAMLEVHSGTVPLDLSVSRLPTFDMTCRDLAMSVGELNSAAASSGFLAE